MRNKTKKSITIKLIENPFFKIVTPVYNTSKYLDKCIQSVLNQTFKDWVWILVDDLSTDGSYEKLLEYEKQYPEHIKVIRVEEKSYAGKARNLAKEIKINSQYTWYIDSDDWLADNNVLQRIYESIQVHDNPDVYYNKYIYYDGKSYINKDNNFILDDIVLKEGSAPWKYVIRSSIDKLARFSESYAYVDVFWFLTIMDNVKTLYKGTKINYIYNFNRNDNITNSFKLNDNIKKQINALVISKDLSLNFNKKIIRERKERFLDIIGTRQLCFKNINYLDLLKNSYVISIDKIRYILFYNLFKKTFNAKANLFKGITSKNKDHAACVMNCKLSHLSIVKKAKELNLPYVMIFEDDAYPCIDCENKLKEYIKYIPIDAKIIMLGYSAINNNNKVNEQKVFNKNTDVIYGTQSYIVFREAYDEFIKITETYTDKPIDNIFSSVDILKDGVYYVSYPLFIQYDYKLSFNKYTGYVYPNNKGGKGVQSKTPPPGFLPIEDPRMLGKKK